MCSQDKNDRRWIRNRPFRIEIHPPVFVSTVAVILVFLLLGMFSEDARSLFTDMRGAVSGSMGWFFVFSVNVFLLFVIGLIISPFGRIRLGGDGSRPEFSMWSWLAMLFSAGMGIGLMFFSVAEPMFHYMAPPLVEPGTVRAAQRAMEITFFHWGFHAWGIYCLVALALAFFAYNRGLPLTIRSAFYPIFGERIHGWPGHVIDVLAAVATLFGVATSLGFGVQQINSGLHFVFEWPIGPKVQVLLIGFITLIATVSVVLGVERGIRRLSELNLVLALALLLFVLTLGPTGFILNAFVENIGRYLGALPQMSFWTEAYTESDWQADWTVFYWAWWIAWSPFVGMFIARVSRGRTVREFLVGVLLVPVGLTFLWMSVFGNTALHVEMFGPGGIAAAVHENLDVALFQLLEVFPLSTVTSLLAVAVVMFFFVTSSDSGSLVIDIITSGGRENPPVAQRIFWAMLEGAVAAVLLVAGGLAALQAAAISAGLPFTLVLLLMVYSLYLGLKRERLRLLASGEWFPFPRQFRRRMSGRAKDDD